MWTRRLRITYIVKNFVEMIPKEKTMIFGKYSIFNGKVVDITSLFFNLMFLVFPVLKFQFRCL